ncbi:MAG: phage holin, LLH family [Bacilli bacterium]
MQEIINAVSPYILELILSIATFIGSIIASKYNEKVKNETTRKIVKDSINYVEQVFKDLHGIEKYNEAIKIASNVLKSKGIKVGTDELNLLIESLVAELNKEIRK